jgi:uncharacterized membrane protein
MSSTAPTPLLKPGSVDALIKQRRKLRDVNKEMAAKRSGLDRVAVWTTVHVGSMGFFLLIAGWTAIWLLWNFLAPSRLQFDPPMAFVFWLFISNVIQILPMPLIMVGQNVLSDHAEARAEHDLEVNVGAAVSSAPVAVGAGAPLPSALPGCGFARGVFGKGGPASICL